MADKEVSDELDYHITFPSPMSRGVDELDFEESEGEDDQKEPLVILLGWVGCHDKYLSKYSAIYEDRCITIRYTAPTEDVFYSPKRLRSQAGKLLELLTDMGLDENPIFVHAFSNGGAFVYRHMTEILYSDSDFSQIQVRGVIFDSAPSQRKVLTAVRAFLSGAQDTFFVMRYILAVFLFLYVVAGNFWRLLRKTFTKSSTDPQDQENAFWIALVNDQLLCPQLFLYSTADKICDYVAVEELISSRKKVGVVVVAHQWDDSAHCQHMRKHRESYVNQCHQFLDVCLQGNPPPPAMV